MMCPSALEATLGFHCKVVSRTCWRSQLNTHLKPFLILLRLRFGLWKGLKKDTTLQTL